MGRPAHSGNGGAADQLLQERAARLTRRRIGAQHVKTTVGGPQRRHGHTALRQKRHPGTIRPQACPAAAAQRQHHRPGGHRHLARRGCKTQGTIVRPAQPAVSHVEHHALPAQALQPGAQQGRGLHVGGEHAAGGAHEGLYTQALRPGPDLGPAKFLQQRFELRLALCIAADKRSMGLGMCEVEPALARQQKLAPHRRHGVEQMNGHPRLGQHLGRHQARRATADDGHIAPQSPRRQGWCDG